MLYLRYEPIGQNIWAVIRETTKVAEVALQLDGHCVMIPVESYAFGLDVLQSLTAFMSEAHNRDSAIVLSDWRETR